MSRKWCPKQERKLSDRGVKRGARYEKYPTFCITQSCCDKNKLWCKEADCSIFECNKIKWNNRRRKIDKKVKKLPKIAREFEELIMKADREGINLTNEKDIRTYDFYVDLFNIITKWHPLEGGHKEIELYYKVNEWENG